LKILEDMKAGVYVCHCGNNISDTVDIGELIDFARGLEGVSVVRDHLFMCSEMAWEMIRRDIVNGLVDRVVIAACTPKNHEKFFRSALEAAGLSKYMLEIANIREQCSWPHKSEKKYATEKAKLLVRSAVSKAALLEPLEDITFSIEKSVLVIGGGIGGITASLDLGNMGYRVYLVEKEPSVGGKLTKFDKIFPLNDCASCVVSPMMAEVATHPLIELITYAEIEDVEGSFGNFRVRVRKKQTYVDWDKCIGCGACTTVCPSKARVPDEFNEGLGWRTAMYIPSPHAVPRKAVHDPNVCVNCGKKTFGTKRFLRNGKEYLTPCEKACPTGAINRSIRWDPEGEIIELDIGAIIVAVGYQVMDKEVFKEYAPHSPNVITALQFERILSPTGPTEGRILKPSDMQKPNAISFISCVGSRDARYHTYCSKVCCLYMLKQARLVKEKNPEINVYIHMIDVRAPGKDLEEYYVQTRQLGINIIRGKVGGIEVLPDGKLRILGFDADIGTPVEVEVDLVVLATAIELPEDARKLARKLGINIDSSGFLKEDHPKLRTVESSLDGIFIAGCCQGPKDVSETIAQAKAAATAVAALMAGDKVRVEPYIAEVSNELCGGCGICISLCPYNALEMAEGSDETEKRVVKRDVRTCKGCGICVSSCPSGAISLSGYDDDQISAQIGAMLGVMAVRV